MPASPQPPTLSPPSGTVVFLFTDIEGSTRRWEADAVAAGAFARDALARARELDDPLAVATVVEEVATLAATREPETAARLFAATEAARARAGQPRSADDQADHDRTLARLRAALAPAAFAAATAAGAGLDSETAAAEAQAVAEASARTGAEPVPPPPPPHSARHPPCSDVPD